MLILCFSIKSISRLGSYFPLRIFSIAELISWNIVGTLWCLFTVTINKGHLFGDKLFRLSLSCRSSKWEFRCCRFSRVFNLSKCRINLCIREFDKILISIDLFLLFKLGFISLSVHIYSSYIFCISLMYKNLIK